MIGTRLASRYEIVRELGHGGMGVVYLAHDPLLEREVAIKLVPPTSLTKETEERLKQEARLVAKLDHPAIVVVHDIGQHEGSLFFVMPFVGGTNLQTLLHDRVLTLGDVLEIGIQVAEALEYAHDLGIVHRDIKPENLMVATSPSGPRVRITDFGLAIASRRRRLTRSGFAVGTLLYCSPEQVSAEEIDGRSDLYSLGSVLYQCVAGRTPFTGDVQAVLYRIVRETPESPRALGAAIDEELEAIVLGCLEKDKLRRPQTARELKEALSRYRAKLKESEKSRALAEGRENLTTPYRQPLLSALVGRDKEFGALQRRLNAALGSECQLAVVSGEAGTGKSRLLAELEELARAREVRVLHGRFVEQDRAFPYQGFCEVLQEYFKAKATGGASSSIPDFSDLAPELFALFPVLTEIGDVRTAQTGDLRASLETALGLDDRLHVFELLARTMARVVGGKPLVVLLEDLHAADVSVEALGYVIRRLGPAPVLFVGTYRTGEVTRQHPLPKLLDSFQGDRRFEEIALGPFTRSEHRAFLSAIAAGAEVDGAIADQLYQASEGNPYFAKELVLSLIAAGEIVKDGSGALVLSSGDLEPSHALPKTIHQAVTRRIERLEPPLQELLSTASVLGRSFAFRDLVLLAGEGTEKVDEALERLLADGFLEEERASRGDRLAFVSGVMREVLYAALPRRQRRKLHRRYAEELERQNAGRLERVTPQLLTHYAAAGVVEKVLEYGLVFARRSLEAWSAAEAARAARLVLDALEELETPDAASEREARRLLASALRHSGDIDGALAEVEKARRLAPDGAEGARIALLGAEIGWQARRVEDTRQHLDAGIAAARAAGDVPTLVRLLSLGATVANLRGDHERARLLLEEAERLQPGDAERAEIPRGGRLSVALPVHVKAAEPGEVLLAEEAEILANVFETLVRADEQGSPVPWLCERWEAEDEGRSFLLTIRTGVVFSDGRPLTAELVARSIARGISRSRGASPAAYAAIRGAAHALAGSSAEIDGLEVVDERRLRFQLVERLPIYPALLTDAKTGIAAEGADGIAVGTGPFRIAAAQSGRTRLERNAAFWGDAPARLDAIEFRTGLHAAQIASGFRAGDYDIARDLLPEDLEEVLRDRRLRPGLVETPLKNTYFVLFSSASAVASRRDVRKALSGVVRTQDVVRRTLGRFAQPAEGLLPPGILGHDPGRRRHPIPRESALESLDASGLPRPLRLAAAVHPVLQDRYASLTSALLSAWADLGVEVTIETPTMTTYLEKGERSDGIDILIGRWIADYDDPDNFTYGLFRTEGGRFRNFLSSLELDELIEEARVEPRPAVRERLYRRFEQLLLDECAVLPLFHEIDYRIASARVVGLKLRPSPPYVNYAELGKLQDSGTLRTTRGIVRVPIAGEVHSLDPSLAFTVAQFEVVSTVFETLTKETEGARIIPWLASSFRAEEGGRRFRFRLREDVRFQDDRRLTARDVRYSFERLLLDAENKNRGILSPITGAEALLSGERGDLEGFRILSSHEFTIDLEKPLSFFPALLAHTSAAIVPEGTDPLNDSWKNRWVGTGPFGLVKFEPGRRLELEANHGYWRLGVPKGEGLVFTFGVPPEEILAGYKSGRFSLAWDLFPADVEALRHDAELGGQYKETPLLSTYYLVFNARKGPLADEELRRELVRSVDVEGLVRRHLGRLAIPAHSLIPPGLLGHETAAARPRSDERARQSVDLTGILHSVYEGAYSSLAKDLFAQLRERGFSVRLEKDTRSDYQRALDSSGADFLAGRWVADYPDSDSFLYGLLHSEKGLFGAMAGTPEVDRLIAAGRAETDPEIRHEIYREAEEVIARRALLLPLFHEQAYRFARPEIDGFDVTFSSPIVAYEKLSVRR